MNKAMVIKALVAGALFVGTANATWAQDKVGGTETYQKAAKFEFGQSRKELAAIEEQIRKSPRHEYPAIEARLIEMLKSSETSTDARRYVCRYLGIVGSEKAVNELSPLLTDERASHPARMALEAIDDPAAGKALVAALDKTQGKLLAGTIGSVGARREASAVQQLAKFTNDSEEVVAAAAIAALGQIGTVDAAKALDEAAGKVAEAQKRHVMRAQITCANQLAAGGKAKEAAEIFGKLARAEAPLAQRAAASQGLVLVADREQALAKMTELLEGSEEELRAAGLAAFREGKDELRAATAERLPTLKPVAQVALIGLLNDSPKVQARNALLAIVQSGKDEQARRAAIECLAVHGEVGDVPMLVKLATGAESNVEKNAAKSALANLGKPGTDETLIKLIDSVEPPARSVVIGALSARHSKQALPVLVKLTRGSDQQAAAEAIGALGEIGTPEELKTLLAIIVNSGDEKLRGAAERAAGNLCARVADPAATSRVLVPAYGDAKAAPAKVAILKLMPRARGEQALQAVTNATKEGDETVRDAAVRVLTSWPEANAIPVLFQLLDKNDNPTHRILAFQGITRLAGQQELEEQKRIDALRKVLEQAQRPEEKKAAIAALGNVRSLAAVELLGKYADDETLVTDAAQAAIRATRELRGTNREKAEAILETFKSKQIGEDVKKRIEEVQKDEAGERRRRR